MTTVGSRSGDAAVVSGGVRFQNPFTFKVGQVFTGFGFGCGVGIGVPSPINLGAIPMVGEVMSATRGATNALSGVSRHVNAGIRKLGVMNIEAGVGCGVGFGHGFGIGLAVKPSALHQLQSCVMQATMKVIAKLNIAPDVLLGQSNIPMSSQSGMSVTNQLSNHNLMQTAPSLPNASIHEHFKNNSSGAGIDHGSPAVRNTNTEASFGRTEKVLNSFLQNPLLSDNKSDINELVGNLRIENSMLQMVLKHQQIIEKLMEENERLHQILVEDLNVPISKLQPTSVISSRFPCSECFECRRKQRRT